MNQIIKQEVFDNTRDVFVPINPTKQQVAFFPKEESQMFSGKNPGFISGTSENESETNDTRAFMERAKKDDAATGTQVPAENTKFYFSILDYTAGQYAHYLPINFISTSGQPDTSLTTTDVTGAPTGTVGTADYSSNNFFIETDKTMDIKAFKGELKFFLSQACNVHIWLHTQTRQLDLVNQTLGSGEHVIQFDVPWDLVTNERVYMVGAFVGGLSPTVVIHESDFYVEYDSHQTVNVASSESIDLGIYGASSPYPNDTEKYKFNLSTINSSHTATDYIGAANMTVAALINDQFATFKLHDIVTNTTEDLFPLSDTGAKLRTITNGFQLLRIPQNRLNTILEDADAIEANGNSNLKKRYGQFYIIVQPKYIEAPVGNIIARNHVSWEDMPNNATLDISGGSVSVIPDTKRRNIYETDKDVFRDLDWQFEASGEQSGRLYGSVVEVWDAALTTLKQVKIMTENEFNFETNDAMRFVLYPDNVGYDSPGTDILTGDILRIYPRETYFDQFVLDISYKDKSVQLESLLAFMLNDMVRDMKTGIIEVYDDKGFSIDAAGNFLGAIINRFQIFQTDKVEARKRLNK